MRKLVNLTLTAIGIGLVAVALTTVSNRPAQATRPSSDVLVVNDATAPVPTVAQGTTQVAGTVGLSGPVALAAGARVQIDPAGGPVATHAVDADQLVHLGVNLDIPDRNVGGAAELYQVPAGKRLTIEHISAHAVLAIGETALLLLQVNIPGESGLRAYYFPTTAADNGFGGRIWVVGQETHMSFDAGTSIAALVLRQGGGNEAVPSAAQFEVIGRLVAEPN